MYGAARLAHLHGVQGVAGSNPATPTKIISAKRYGSVPGLEPGGGGSTPSAVTKNNGGYSVVVCTLGCEPGSESSILSNHPKVLGCLQQ